MKFVPARASRFVGRVKLKTSANSPTILLYAGIAGVVGTTVLASRATLKAQPVLEANHLELQKLEYDTDKAMSSGIRPDEAYLRKQRVAIYTTTAVQLTKLYGPSVIVGVISVGCLVKGHNIQKDRYSALGAAYIGLQEGFDRYRERVRKEIGEDKEKELYYDAQDITVYEAGPNGPKKKQVKVVGPNGGSRYARFFDEDATEWKSEPQFNVMLLRQTEAWLNTKLRANGHVFLNDLWRELGMSDTEEGAVCCWLYERGYGDNEIDLGIWTDEMRDQMYDFMVGNTGAILIDPNVAGPIHKLLNLPKVRN